MYLKQATCIIDFTKKEILVCGFIDHFNGLLASLSRALTRTWRSSTVTSYPLHHFLCMLRGRSGLYSGTFTHTLICCQQRARLELRVSLSAVRAPSSWPRGDPRRGGSGWVRFKTHTHTDTYIHRQDRARALPRTNTRSLHWCVSMKSWLPVFFLPRVCSSSFCVLFQD